MNKSLKFICAVLTAGLPTRCKPDHREQSSADSDHAIDTIKAGLLLTLAYKIKRDKELDSLYAVIDEGLLNPDSIPADLLKEIDARMTGGWGDSNFPDSVSATSFLGTQGEHTYYAKNAFDFDIQTAWVEGKDDLGIGESILFHFRPFREGEPLTSVTIYNGYQRDAKSWEQNSRVKRLKMFVNEKAVAVLELEDTMQGQVFLVRVDLEANKAVVIRFEILEAFAGSKWRDTAITQILFDGEWQGI